MVSILTYGETDFSEKLTQYLSVDATTDPALRATVEGIVAAVKARGDEALLESTNQFDRTGYTADDLRVTAAEIEAAYASVDPQLIACLELAATRIRDYHTRQLPADELYTDESGTELGWKWTAIDRVGLYVPGGKAAYPSSVLMNAIPAQVAGVQRMAMVVPTPDGVLNPVVLAAAHVAGITEIYKVGGAQAVAALAYGTATIPKVDKIVGPGNAYVAEAKRQVFGAVGIDMIAGPSEILVLSDGSVDPAWLAADLLSQAEHDQDARSILVTHDAAHADAVAAAVETTLGTLAREDIARTSWEKNGLVIVADTLEQAVKVTNDIAPEHLELAVVDATVVQKSIRHAGAIFMGAYTPEAVGDYMAGPSHVLPTSGTARFSSGLDVYAFLKRSSLIGASRESLAAYGAQTADFADSEGLGAHALSVRVRL